MARKTIQVMRVLLLAGLILALGVVPALASGNSARINAKAKVFLSAAETGSLKQGTKVNVTATKGEWAQIKYKGKVGYVKLKYLTAVQGVTGYVKKQTHLYKSASKSSEKSPALPVGTQLKIVGVNGKFYQVTNGSVYGYIPKAAVSKKKPSQATIIASQVQKINWSAGNKLFDRGDYVKLYDIQTGITLRAYRLGGTNHAELEPATAADTKKLLKMGGGEFSWNSRPVILYAGGKLLAAAINTMPHGEQSITDNNFDGQFCLHLPGSKTHGTDTVNANHQAAIKYAYQWAKSKCK